MSPHADHECTKCQKVFDLPIGATHCPECKKAKWFLRLFNSVNVSTTGIAKKKDPQLEAAYTAARAPKEAAKLSDRQRGAPMLAVDHQPAPNVLAHFARSQFQ